MEKYQNSKWPIVLFSLYVILCVVLAFNPVHRGVWLVENATVWIVLIPIIILYFKKIRFSPLSYILMALFAYWHTIGGHYTFSNVPFDVVNDLLGSERNNFDRIGHFMVGFYAYPIIELIRSKHAIASRTLSYTFGILSIISVAAIYELFEWQYAILSDPEAGLAVLGSQGDIWDAQKDILMDTLGAITVTILAVFTKPGEKV